MRDKAAIKELTKIIALLIFLGTMTTIKLLVVYYLIEYLFKDE